MKTLNTAISNLIAERLGNEPINTVEVQWVVDGNWHVYGDKKIENYEFAVDGVIQSLSTLETVVKLDSQGQSTGINIVLSDHKGDLKGIIDNNDIHGRLVRIYQWFEGLPLSERFLLYEGEITSSITWNEGDRTLAFSAITQLADKEAGFSPEEGNFPFLPDDMVGKAWPLIFGKVQNVPTVRLFDVPTTQTVESVEVEDRSILEQIAKLQRQRTDLVALLQYYTLAAAQAAFTCDFGETQSQREQACAIQEQLEATAADIAQQISALDEELFQLNTTLQEQEDAVKNTLTVVNGSAFPQGENITIKIGNVILNGQMNGNIFTIYDRDILDYNYEDGDDPFGFTFIQAGTTVSIKTESPLIYILSIVPCEVHIVQAYRRVENDDVLVVVPNNWYTVKTTNIGSYDITYIEVPIPISSQDETMQDDLYVTCTSTIGPNTVDIMEWLIGTYTDLSYDPVTFADTKVKLENYPSHFALLERKNVIQLLEEIAFQSRCAIWVSNKTFYLRYLSEEQTEQDTITESDIDAGTLELFTTDTEELVTKLIATWTDNYALNEKNTLILRHNIKKYGTREREIEFYIYNLPELVLKSATFWLIRFSNIWKNIRFKTYPHKMALETFDIVNFNFNQNFVADTAVKGMLTNVTYDSDAQVMNVEAWLPVKFGTMVIYIFGWPGQIDPDNLFPTQEEILIGYAGGDGPGTSAEGGFALTDDEKEQLGYKTLYEYNSGRERYHRRDYGDERPSDIDDVKPVPSFVGTGFIVTPGPEWDYRYGDYEFKGYVPPSVETEAYTLVFPGYIKSQTSTEGMYNVAIYKEGLGNPSEDVVAKQLQIGVGSEIPTGSWVLVAGNEIGEGENKTIEWTMQVPVWL